MNIRNFKIQPIYVVKDILAPNWSWISDSNRWTGFHLWYLFKNSVKIQTEKEEYSLSEGDTFLFDLSQNHHCTHDPHKPAAMFTAYFQCDYAEELQAMLRNGTISRKNHPQLYNTNMQLFAEAARNSNTPDETQLWLAPIFHQLFSPITNPMQQSKIAEVCQMIDSAPQKNYSLDELAEQAGYSKNQFIRLFHKSTGFTPYAYIIHTRIERAKHLLRFSDYTVTEISIMLGYRDLNHFSSQFFKKVGCYPSQYSLFSQ